VGDAETGEELFSGVKETRLGPETYGSADIGRAVGRHQRLFVVATRREPRRL
jgi:hypothetical protein